MTDVPSEADNEHPRNQASKAYEDAVRKAIPIVLNIKDIDLILASIFATHSALFQMFSAQYAAYTEPDKVLDLLNSAHKELVSANHVANEALKRLVSFAEEREISNERS